MLNNLSEILESILFVAGEPVMVSDISGKLDVTDKEMEEAIEALKAKYSGECGITLLHFNDKLQLASNSAYGEAVATVLNPIRERNLSKATLETAAIIAYKQPITRLEIEEIRGVGCDYAISILMEHNLIEVVGRKDAVGRPVLFGTTDEFLKRFNISSIKELPDYNELLEKVKVIRTNTDSLYNEYDVPTDPILAEKENKENGENEALQKDLELTKEVDKVLHETIANSSKSPNEPEKHTETAKPVAKFAFHDIIKEDDVEDAIKSHDDEDLIKSDDDLLSAINSSDDDDEII